MRVAIDTSLTASKHTTGIGRYVEGLVRTLSKQGVELSVWDSAGQWGLPIPGAGIRNGILRKAFYLVWLNGCFPWIIKKRNIHVAHFTNFLPPLLPLRKPCPYVITIHDVHVLRYPGYNPAYKLYRQAMLSRAVKMADFIIVPSRHVKQDLCDLLDVPAEKIHVIYHGISEDFLLDIDEVLPFENRKHILSVGPLNRRKNHGALISAYAQVLEWNPSFRYDLVITGDLKDKASEPLMEIIHSKGIESRVHLVGHVDQERLQKLYKEAVLFVFPSKYEGFGFPCLEAMASGTPVIASNVTSIPEVVGKDGRLVEPDDIDGLARAIVEMLQDPGIWYNYGKMPLNRLWRFTKPPAKLNFEFCRKGSFCPPISAGLDRWVAADLL
ncbi:MAG: glycosyltransferase family 1 protein, partial [Eubacteriales bacterium]